MLKKPCSLTMSLFKYVVTKTNRKSMIGNSVQNGGYRELKTLEKRYVVMINVLVRVRRPWCKARMATGGELVTSEGARGVWGRDVVEK